MDAPTFDQLPNAVFQLIIKLDKIEKLLLQSTDQKTEQDNPEQLLTIKEAAEFLRLSVPTLYSKVSRGELPVMKRSKRLYFSSTELMEYLKDGRKISGTQAAFAAEFQMYNPKRDLKNGRICKN